MLFLYLCDLLFFSVKPKFVEFEEDFLDARFGEAVVLLFDGQHGLVAVGWGPEQFFFFYFGRHLPVLLYFEAARQQLHDFV
jgi:hypothetical protein